jgi:hypothetical protein
VNAPAAEATLRHSLRFLMPPPAGAAAEPNEGHVTLARNRALSKSQPT